MPKFKDFFGGGSERFFLALTTARRCFTIVSIVGPAALLYGPKLVHRLGFRVGYTRFEHAPFLAPRSLLWCTVFIPSLFNTRH